MIARLAAMYRARVVPIQAIGRCVALALAVGLAACSPPPTASPSRAPSASDVSVIDGVVVGCVSFEQAECEAVARQVLARVPEGPVAPFSILLTLFDCPNAGACAKSLAARDGAATVDFPGGREPAQFALRGPANRPGIRATDGSWPDVSQPASKHVVGAGPFPFALGHCGLMWQVDFDGSFWVPVGQVDGSAPEFVNSGSGSIRLLGPNLAVYIGAEGFTAGLQRFPGAKHLLLCG